ncbi:MAG: hypothetical protein ABI454_10980 [Sphingomicrobium sp.]
MRKLMANTGARGLALAIIDDGQTANMLVCIEKTKRCILLLSNDVRAEAGFAGLIGFILGNTGVPLDWEYGDHAGKSD